MTFKEYALQPWLGDGLSANCLKDFRVSHNYPHDPDDWCRCFQVLRLMFGDNENRKQAHILSVASQINSRVWKNIGENYHELQNIFMSEWDSNYAPKTYVFMQKMIKEELTE